MRQWLTAVAAVGFVAAGCGASAAAEGDTPQIQIEYGEPTGNDAAIAAAHDVLVNYKALEELRQFLAPLKLPTDLNIHAAQCGAMRHPYDTSSKTVTICYEQIARILDVISQQTDADSDKKHNVAVGAIVETLLHESAYGLFDLYDVPIWGRAEDAADRLAALVMTQFGTRAALVTVSGAAQYLFWSAHSLQMKDFASAQSPEAQRFYDFLCVATGADPIDFEEIAKENLPPLRLGYCFGNLFGTKTEYDEIRRAFDLRIMPFVDPDALVRARATNW